MQYDTLSSNRVLEKYYKTPNAYHRIPMAVYNWMLRKYEKYERVYTPSTLYTRGQVYSI